MYPIQDTSRIEKVRMKQEEESEFTKQLLMKNKIYEKREFGHDGKISK